MQMWEYCEIEVTIGGPISRTKGELYIFKPDGKHASRKVKLGEALAQLGREGWNLVGSSARTGTGLGSKHKINYILKRPIED